MKVKIMLTDHQAKKLIDTLENHEDSGPAYEGWKSEELIDLISEISRQVQEQQP